MKKKSIAIKKSSKQNTIKIAYRPYKITEKHEVLSEDGCFCYGKTNCHKGEIEIEKDLGTKYNNTLIHELLHAMLDESGADCLIEEHEIFVRILTPTLLNVIEQIIEKKMLK